MSTRSISPSPFVRWLDSDAVLMIERIVLAEEPLTEQESQQASDMTPPRRQEFAAGRALSRRAASLLLGRPVKDSVPMGDAGEPIWPSELRGSISHTATHVAVILARAERYRAVGIDLDDGRQIGAAAAADLMTEEEVQVVQSLGWATGVEDARNIVFSAKEALFKYQYPLTGDDQLDFDDVLLHRMANERFLRASAATVAPVRNAALCSARLFFKEIQEFRVCCALPESGVS